MQQSRTPPINVIDIRAHEYTPDGKGIIVSLATKYSAERRNYSVPVECLYNLISDLRTLKPPSNGAAPEPADEPSQQAPALSNGGLKQLTGSVVYNGDCNGIRRHSFTGAVYAYYPIRPCLHGGGSVGVNERGPCGFAD